MAKTRLLCKVAWFICVMSPLTTQGVAQDFPTRPVKIITQGAAGSGPDVVARVVFDQLGRQWNHRFG